MGEETNDITAASRCVLFRGIRAPDAPLPDVTLNTHLEPVEDPISQADAELDRATSGK